MSTGIQNTIQPLELQKKIVASVDETAQKADAEKEAKMAAYNEAMGQLNVFEQAKNKAYSKFKSLQSSCKNSDNSELRTAQAEYSSICSSYSDANINTDILRSSLLSSIFYSGKMNNSAILANSTLA